MGDLTKNFSRSEFACKCECGAEDVSMDLVFRLQKIRDRLSEKYGENSPKAKMTVNSGIRCPRHNAIIGGKPQSEHIYGEAADIALDGSTRRFDFAILGVNAGFLRIGLDDSFVHFGVSKDKPQGVLWLY